MQGTKQTPTVDQAITETYRGLTLAIKATTDGGYTVSATSGPEQHDALTDSFTNLDDARSYWRDIKNLALDGQAAHQIAVKLGRAEIAGSYEWTAPIEPAATLAAFAVDRNRQVPIRRGGASTKPPATPTIRAMLIALIEGIVWRSTRTTAKHLAAPRSVLDAGGTRLMLALTAEPGRRAANWQSGTLTDLGRRWLATNGFITADGALTGKAHALVGTALVAA